MVKSFMKSHIFTEEAEMKVKFDMEALGQYVQDIYHAAGIRVSIFGADFTPIVEYPEDLPPFCRLVRRTREGAEACRSCDVAACRRARERAVPYRYRCHCGLTEVCMPVRSGGETVGYAFLAHLLSDRDGEEERRAARLAARFGISESEALAALGRMQHFAPEKIAASERLLAAVVSYPELKRMMTESGEDFEQKVLSILREHMAEKIGSELFCKELFISRTHLYQLSLKNFGCGIMQYAAKQKMLCAQKLLAETAKPVSAVAREVGFCDYNYFCKKFHAFCGSSPSAYREAARAGAAY